MDLIINGGLVCLNLTHKEHTDKYISFTMFQAHLCNKHVFHPVSLKGLHYPFHILESGIWNKR